MESIVRSEKGEKIKNKTGIPKGNIRRWKKDLGEMRCANVMKKSVIYLWANNFLRMPFSPPFFLLFLSF